MSEVNKKRLLLLNYEFPPLGGGASPVSYELAQQLAEHHNWEIDVVTMGFAGLAAYESPQPGLHIYRVPCWRQKKETCQPHEQLSYLLPAYWQCRALMRQHRYQMCHAHFLIPTAIVALILHWQYHLPYIVTSHGSDVPGFNPDRFTFLHLFTQPLLKIIANTAAAVVAPSHYLAELILTKIDPQLSSKLQYIPNGISLSRIKALPKKAILFSSGRLLPRKGFQYLIQAVSQLKTEFELHIAGDGPYRNELETLAKESLTKVVFHGWLANTSKTYQELLGQASIYCLVSERENASVALLEAMAAKCAIITANTTGAAETVAKTGVLVAPRDVTALQTALQLLITSPARRQALATAAHERVSTVFDLKKTVTAYDKILTQHSLTR